MNHHKDRNSLRIWNVRPPDLDGLVLDLSAKRRMLPGSCQGVLHIDVTFSGGHSQRG